MGSTWTDQSLVMHILYQLHVGATYYIRPRSLNGWGGVEVMTAVPLIYICSSRSMHAPGRTWVSMHRIRKFHATCTSGLHARTWDSMDAYMHLGFLARTGFYARIEVLRTSTGLTTRTHGVPMQAPAGLTTKACTHRGSMRHRVYSVYGNT